MRVTRWTLLAAALAVSVYAKDAAPTKSDATCVAPAEVSAFESKIGGLQEANAALQLKVDAQAADKTKLLQDVAKEHEKIVLKLQDEIKTLKIDVGVLEKDVESQHKAAEKAAKDVAAERKAAEKAEEELKAIQAKLSAESARADSRESDVTKVEKELAKERAAATKHDAELKAALGKLAEETKRASTLDKSHQSVEKKRQALLKEISEAKTVELSMASLLSSYYDESLELAEQAMAFAQQKLDEQSETLELVQNKITEATKTASDSSSKFYQENLAETLDPIFVDVHKTVSPVFADVHKAVNPHVEKYLPIVQNEAVKAKEQAVQYSKEALRRAKLARLEAITLLEQNEHLAGHAQKVIDGVLIVLAVPLVLFQTRLALRLAWWLLTTTLYLLSCGLCCGARKRGPKTKRKSVKKTASVNASLNAPLNGPTKKTTTNGSKTTSTSSQKRGKKGKN